MPSNKLETLEPLIPIKKTLADVTLPISESNLFAGIVSGKYPTPTKIGRRNFYTPSVLRAIRASFGSSQTKSSAVSVPLDAKTDSNSELEGGTTQNGGAR